ncbi:MAG: hypothetical protein GY796_16085 [Chloroflexi bacterium]|nr:hypothetical protein [Chloroflexota bacterium]
MGTEKRDRPSYKLWEEPKGPDFVIEITSKSTWSQDQGPKKGTYAFLGVREYFQYDLTQDYLDPPLQGYRLVDGYYLPIPPVIDTDKTITLYSNILGLDVCLESGDLRFYDLTNETKLLSYDEVQDTRLEAEQRARQEAAARQTAEQRAIQETAARQTAEQRAEQEVMARKAAEIRIAELEAKLRSLQND